MVARLAVMAALALVGPAAGEQTRRERGQADVDVLVPVDPQAHERIWWMHRRDRRLIPPTVSIGGEPYVCDLDGRRFPDRGAFLAHLQGEHGVAPDRIPDLLYDHDGDVHFPGE